MLHALCSAFCSICGESVLLDVKALDGPEATLKGIIIQSLTHGGMNAGPATR